MRGLFIQCQPSNGLQMIIHERQVQELDKSDPLDKKQADPW